MTDIQDLKAIAERCKAHQPLRFMRSHGALYIRNDNGIVFDVHQNRSFPEFMAQNKDYADLVLAANPAAVLELIAEIEDQKLQVRSAREVCVESQGTILTLIADRDHLKSENERLELESEDTLKKFEEAVEGFTKLSADILDLRQQLAVPSDVLADCEALRLENEALRENNDKLTRRNGMLEENVTALSATHVRYTWLRKKADQPYNDFVSVTQNIGHDWIVVHDLDRAVDQMIGEEQP